MADKDEQVSHQDNDQTSDDGIGDTTSAFRADFLGQRDASAAAAAEAGVWGVEKLPQRLGPACPGHLGNRVKTAVNASTNPR
jgi:hypothetical protein